MAVPTVVQRAPGSRSWWARRRTPASVPRMCPLRTRGLPPAAGSSWRRARIIAPSLSPAQTEIGARSPQVAKWRRLSSSAGGSLEPGLQRTCREASSASFSRGALFLPRSERALRMLAGDTGLAPASRADVLCSEMASARVPARLEPGSSNVHRVAAVRGSAGVQPSSARFGCFTVPWLIAGVIGAAAGCTLTEKPFDEP